MCVLGDQVSFPVKTKGLPRRLSSGHYSQQSAFKPSSSRALHGLDPTMPNLCPTPPCTHLVLGLLTDQPEEEKAATGGVHFWEGV